MKQRKYTNLDLVRDAISVLSVQERVTIRTYMSSFIEKGRESTNRSLKLFDILVSLKGKKIQPDEVQKLLFGNANPNSVNHQIARLKDKILEGLIIDINVERDDVYPETTRANISVRKNLTQAQILLNRGERKCAEFMFEKIIEKCTIHELYEEALIAIRSLLRIRVLNEGNKRLEPLFKKYKKYDYIKNAILNAEINYGKVISKADFHSVHTSKTAWLREMLDEMSEDFKKTESIQIGYYYYYIEAQFHQLLHNFKSARRSLLSLQRLLNSGIVMNIPELKGGVMVNLGDNDLFLSQFERAYDILEESLESFKKDNFNYQQAIESMFYAKFYIGDYEMALDLIYQLLPESQTENNFRKGKRGFLLAATYFMMQDFSVTLKHLNLVNPIVTDKGGWSLGMKLLHILTLIELQDFDEATTKIDALRKFFANGGQNHRMKLIYQVLQSLTYTGYDFKAVYQKEKGCIEMLQSKSGALAWYIKSPEMIIFHQWIFAKAFKQKHIQKIDSFQLSDNSVTVIRNLEKEAE